MEVGIETRKINKNVRKEKNLRNFHLGDEYAENSRCPAALASGLRNSQLHVDLDGFFFSRDSIVFKSVMRSCIEIWFFRLKFCS
jgi:hypothetical protein